MAKESIRKIVNSINNPDENGGLWLPNIQRYFVWDQEQICKLYDSLMRYYPFGSVLTWRTKEEVKNRRFIDNYKDGIKFTDFYRTKDTLTKRLVLDGQQRLQSFYISLKGSYNKRELYFNVLSTLSKTKNIKEETLYEFAFLDSALATQVTTKFKLIDKKWISVKNVIFNNSWEISDLAKLGDEIGNDFNDKDKFRDLVTNNVTRLQKVLTNEDLGINIIQLDSIDQPDIYSLDDVVEIFIRANSGGTKLEKSDLLFSLLTASWETIEEDIESFLAQFNAKKFYFERDFILKVCLVLNDLGAKYSVEKFRETSNLQKIEDNWKDIKESIEDVVDFLTNNSYITSGKALTSTNALIPLIYFRFHYETKWRSCNKLLLSSWLVRILLTGAFSGSSDTIIDVIVKIIKEKQDFDIDKINSDISNRNRNVYLTFDSIFNNYYQDANIYLIFSLLYNPQNLTPFSKDNLPSEDHIFPQSLLKSVKIINPESGRNNQKYSKYDRNQIANLMLLSIQENRDEKNAIAPETWFSNKSQGYLELHYIPKDRTLWKLEKFELFLEERKKLIFSKMKDIGLVA
ncbi:MAG: DUF262 domain-containing protein [Leptospiraceae bacterium]|nr:DUF262 domain-containing protein [Leptospiraceae bacterium]